MASSASSSVTPQSRDADKQLNTGASSSSSFDDLDPFANWPPRPSGSSSASGTSNNDFNWFHETKSRMSTLGPYNDKKSTDLGSIFGSSKNEQLAPKLAPPP
ncbi:hypothetical protein GH714_014872 [Hevea brasiliensis]|uniref:Uncharacterized protein n=1 Tax=Hevea brasiliensis TaxID=3981 RepID=A0A6A6KNV5_HEVBR|nr:hypothetical protein GH714_014872 [Hevea brasiliensis]